MSDTRFANQRIVGTSVLPDEAIPLIEGDGRFLNDIKIAGMYHVAFLRSSMAHARIVSIDTAKARALPGVIAVVTGQDILGKVEPFRSMPNRFSGGQSTQHWLAIDKVRFCGEAICAVVAEDRAIAEDGVEAIELDLEPLPVVTDPPSASATTPPSSTTPAPTTTSSSASTSAARYRRPSTPPTSSSNASSASAASRRFAWKAAAAWPPGAKARSC